MSMGEETRDVGQRAEWSGCSLEGAWGRFPVAQSVRARTGTLKVARSNLPWKWSAQPGGDENRTSGLHKAVARENLLPALNKPVIIQTSRCSFCLPITAVHTLFCISISNFNEILISISVLLVDCGLFPFIPMCSVVLL